MMRLRVPVRFEHPTDEEIVGWLSDAEVETSIVGGAAAQGALQAARRAHAVAGKLLAYARTVTGDVRTRVLALGRRVLDAAKVALSAHKSSTEIAGLAKRFPRNATILGAGAANAATARRATAQANRAAELGLRALAKIHTRSVVLGGGPVTLPRGWDGGFSQ